MIREERPPRIAITSSFRARALAVTAASVFLLLSPCMGQGQAAPQAVTPRLQLTHSRLLDQLSASEATRSGEAETSVAAFSVTPRKAVPPSDRKQRASWFAPLASAIIPGTGQALLGQQRSVAYVVAEGYLLLIAQRAQRDGNRDRARYRDIASTVARGGASQVGSWDYYESMEKYQESGVFDRFAGGAVDPETDTASYNGKQWLLARQNNWSDPDAPPPVNDPAYQRALAFYVSRAVRDEFRWSWRDAGTQRELYKSTIVAANRSYQNSTTLKGLVKANHLISLIDAYVAVRLRRYGGAGVDAHFSAHLEPSADMTRMVWVPTLTGRFPAPRITR